MKDSVSICKFTPFFFYALEILVSVGVKAYNINTSFLSDTDISLFILWHSSFKMMIRNDLCLNNTVTLWVFYDYIYLFIYVFIVNPPLKVLPVIKEGLERVMDMNCDPRSCVCGCVRVMCVYWRAVARVQGGSWAK